MRADRQQKQKQGLCGKARRAGRANLERKMVSSHGKCRPVDPYSLESCPCHCLRLQALALAFRRVHGLMFAFVRLSCRAVPALSSPHSDSIRSHFLICVRAHLFL